MSRDNLIPYSDFFKELNEYTLTPLNTLILITFF